MFYKLLQEVPTDKQAPAQNLIEKEVEEAIAPASKKQKKEKNKNKKTKVPESAPTAADVEPKSPALAVEPSKVPVQSNPDSVAAPAEPQSLSKTKKQKLKKDKKKKEANQNRPEEDSSVSEEVSMQQKPVIAAATESVDSIKAKPGKEKKNKKDKKKAVDAAVAAATSTSDKIADDAITDEKKVYQLPKPHLIGCSPYKIAHITHIFLLWFGLCSSIQCNRIFFYLYIRIYFCF